MASIVLPRPMMLVLVALGLATAVVVWMRVADTLINVKPVAPAARPDSITWDNYVFASRGELERWLHARGINYRDWARRHRASAAILEHRPLPATTISRAPTPPRAATTRAPSPTRTAPAPTATPRTIPGEPASHLRLIRDVVLVLLLVVALVLGLGATVPGPFRARFPEASARLWPHRAVLAAAAGAIAMGVAIGALLG